MLFTVEQGDSLTLPMIWVAKRACEADGLPKLLLDLTNWEVYFKAFADGWEITKGPLPITTVVGQIAYEGGMGNRKSKTTLSLSSEEILLFPTAYDVSVHFWRQAGAVVETLLTSTAAITIGGEYGRS